MTYDEKVQVFFNLEKIRWLKIDDLVRALKIASGSIAPPEYYQAIAGDKEAGANLMGQTMLSKMMGGS